MALILKRHLYLVIVSTSSSYTLMSSRSKSISHIIRLREFLASQNLTILENTRFHLCKRCQHFLILSRIYTVIKPTFNALFQQPSTRTLISGWREILLRSLNIWSLQAYIPHSSVLYKERKQKCLLVTLRPRFWSLIPLTQSKEKSISMRFQVGDKRKPNTEDLEQTLR